MVSPLQDRSLCRADEQGITVEHAQVTYMALLIDLRFQHYQALNAGLPGEGGIDRFDPVQKDGLRDLEDGLRRGKRTNQFVHGGTDGVAGVEDGLEARRLERHRIFNGSGSNFRRDRRGS